MTKPNRAIPGGRNRRILANGRSSGRSTTRWPGWNVRRTARIVPVSAAGPASARGVPGELRVTGGGAGHTGSRRRGGWPSAGVSASRQPRCRLRDRPFWAGLATWWQPVIPGRQSQRRTTAWPPRPARGTGPRRRDRDGVVLAGAWCGIPLAKVLQNPDWGPQRADSHHLQPAGPSRPPRLAAASPGWKHRPWRACRARGQRNGRGPRRWPRPSGMRAAVRGLPGRVASAWSGGGWQPSGQRCHRRHAARQQCAPSRHRARTRRSETRRPDGVCSRSVIDAPPDRSAHSRRYARPVSICWDSIRAVQNKAFCAVGESAGIFDDSSIRDRQT